MPPLPRSREGNERPSPQGEQPLGISWEGGQVGCPKPEYRSI